MSKIDVDVERGIQKGLEQGCCVLRGDPHHLLLDFDSAAMYKRFRQMYADFDRFFPVDSMSEWPSSSGGEHRHVLLRLKKPIKSAALRSALQAALGSDPMREMFSAICILDGGQEPSLLYVPPGVTLRKPTTLVYSPASIWDDASST